MWFGHRSNDIRRPEYEFLSENEAIKLVKNYVRDNKIRLNRFVANFVWDISYTTSPFDPVWEVRSGSFVFIVKQNGEVTLLKKVPEIVF